MAARASFRAFLEKSPRGGDAEQFRAIAKTKLAALEKAIPTLSIQISGFTAGTSVELDGARSPPPSSPPPSSPRRSPSIRAITSWSCCAAAPRSSAAPSASAAATAPRSS